jgi:hypothetical protein
MADRPVSPRPAHQDATFGTPAAVDWITRQTVTGLTITSAIPPTFDAYATIVDVEPWSESGSAAQDVAIVGHLQRFGPPGWWLGYLDTGGSDVVFPRSLKITTYADWPYVIVKGDAASALGWRAELPDLIFPEDRSWLVSTLWDDSWMCVGGSQELVDALLGDPRLQARQVGLEEDSTPPGHVAI